MHLIDKLAEERITRAVEQGELDNLPTAGQPLPLDDDQMVPETLRAAYRILKNAGYVPPEIEPQQEIRDAESLIRMARTQEERTAAVGRLRVLLNRLGRRRSNSLLVEDAYYTRLCERLDGNHDTG